MSEFIGKTVIVTGGSRGIGFGVASAFAEKGANIVITARSEGPLEEAAKKISEKYNVKAIWVTGDGGDEESVKNVISKAVETFGKIDVVVNNAQVSKSGVLLVDHSKEDFDVAMYSGLYATFFYMKHAFPYLKETKGSVINFASGAGLFGKLGQGSYAAAKEGIRGMSRVAAAEWGEFGINVNVICPLAMTPGLEKWKEAYPALYEKTINDIPMRRFADPQKDIGSLCVFLASEAGSFITGEAISLQGGSGLRP